MFLTSDGKKAAALCYDSPHTHVGCVTGQDLGGVLI